MSLQSQTAVLEQRTFRKPQFNLLLWTMLALVAIGISAGIYALFVGHHYSLGVTRDVPWGIAISTYAAVAAHRMANEGRPGGPEPPVWGQQPGAAGQSHGLALNSCNSWCLPGNRLGA